MIYFDLYLLFYMLLLYLLLYNNYYLNLLLLLVLFFQIQSKRSARIHQVVGVEVMFERL